ncbi:hypothetical protein BDW22DRAFT_1346647 [Trametopsis cervina]|nr:hypothetical protein BDW22DRAFT_1346647 [Trametopsis cervina]
MVNRIQMSSHHRATDSSSGLATPVGLEPSLVLELPIAESHTFMPSLPRAPDSVSSLISGRTLNSLSLLVGLFTIVSVVAWRTRMRSRGKKVPGTLLTTPVRAATALLAAEAEVTPTDANLSTDLDDTLDESSISSPCETDYFSQDSSPQMLAYKEAPASLSFTIDSPVFQHIWKSNAFAVAEIAYKRRRATTVSKLQRWAAKRHEQAVQEAAAASRQAQLESLSHPTSMLGTSASGTFQDQGLSSSGYVKNISPRASRKLRVRRESLRAESRNAEAVAAGNVEHF